MRLTIFKKGLLLVAVPFLFQFCFIGIALLFDRSQALIVQIRAQNKMFFERSREIASTVANAETASRAYLLSGDRTFLEELKNLQLILAKQIDALKLVPGADSTVAGDEPDVEAGITSLGVKCQQLMDRLNNSIDKFQRARTPKADLKADVEAEAKLASQIRDQLSALETEVRDKNQRRYETRNSASAASWMRWIYFGGTIASLLFTLVMGLVFSHRIRANLATLAENARRLQAGSDLANPIKGNDEIAQVDRSFRQMAQALIQSRDELQTQSHLLQSILDNMGNAVIVADSKGVFRVFNSEAQRLFGKVDPNASLGDWLTNIRFSNPADRTPLDPAQFPLFKSLNGQPVDESEVCITHPNEPDIWAVITSRPLMGSSNDVRAAVAVIRDTTEQKRAADKLRRSAAEILELYNTAPCGYHSLDPNGIFLAINDTELKWTGYERSELVGRRSFAELLTEESANRFRDAFHHVHDNVDVTNLEYDLIRKDGSQIPILLNSNIVRDAEGKHIATRVTIFDITERKKAEATIKIYSDIVKSVPIGVSIWRMEEASDAKSISLVASNPAASNLLRIDLNQHIGRRMTDIFPLVSNAEFEVYAKVIRTGETAELQNVYSGDPHHPATYWQVKAFALPGKCVGLAFEDVTVQRNTQEQLYQLNEQLEQRVAQRTSELAEANRDLGQKNQENEMFVYSVSHDLRSPLVNLEGFSRELTMIAQEMTALLATPQLTEDIRAKLTALLSSDVAESIRYIQSGVRRLTTIIDSLLRLSRVGRIEYQIHAIDVNATIARIVDSMQSTINQKHAKIVIQEMPRVLGDSTAVELLFANLIGNALNYLDPKRPGEIEIGCDEQSISKSTDGFGAFFVKDNGVGIATNHQAKIFQAFQRAHPDLAPGEGMGLAIVKRIVERHRGRVWVQSEPGKGSTFYAALPMSFAKLET